MSVHAHDPAARAADLAGASLMAAFRLGLSVAICHGVGRFAYALVMPAMQEDLGWSFAQASWMNTANALGYILGTVTGYLLLARVPATRLFRAGLMLCTASILLMGLDLGFVWFIGVRLMSGVGAAWAFATGGTLVGELYPGDARRRGAALGVFFGCAGIGMVLTAAITPALFAARGPGSWPGAWLALGVACSVVMAWPLLEARDHGRSAGTVGSGVARVPARLWSPVLAYFGFGVAHTGYVFFVFAWTRAQSLPWFFGAGMWVVLGLGVLFSAALWKGALARWPPSRTLAAGCFAVGLGGALPLLHLQLGIVYASAFLVGSSLFIAPSAMAVLARHVFPTADRGSGLMVFSIVFAMGQTIGSWGFGHLADEYSLNAVLAASSVGLIVAALIASRSSTEP